jgi:hypothetical protein
MLDLAADLEAAADKLEREAGGRRDGPRAHRAGVERSRRPHGTRRGLAQFDRAKPAGAGVATAAGRRSPEKPRRHRPRSG